MRVLLVEDDLLLSATLTKVLGANHYTIDLAENGQVGLDLASSVEYDLILLDVQVPKIDGLSLCRQLRLQGYCKPILLLTAYDSDADAVAGFEAGADDYIGKPCAPEVLLARMRTWLRRSSVFTATPHKQSSHTVTWGELCLDLDAGRVTVGEQVITLTVTEYNLLQLFLQNPDRIFSRSAILDRLWSLSEAPSDRAIVTYVKDVRKKLKAGGLREELIETVYGMGYRLKPAPPGSIRQTDASQQTSDCQRQRNGNGRSKLDQVLTRFQGGFSEQVAVLEQAKTALVAGKLEIDLLQAARQESHKLAGSLASFGYPAGSKLARSIEHLLMTEPTALSHHLARFSQLLVALQQELTKSPVPSTPLSTATPQVYQILVVDDDVTLTERLKAESNAWGVCLQTAATVAEARSHLALNPPDVVLLDLNFPAAADDGFTLLQEIRSHLPHLPVIVLTGRDSLADRIAVSRLGVRQFLPKPASSEQIFRLLTRIVRYPAKSQTKVLIVDDDPAMLDLLSSLLTPWGIEVTTLSTPQDFWTVLESTCPNLVLLDLEMPQINGLELCQVVRQDAHWESLPLLVVTAHTDAHSLQQAFASGADDFIAKPVLEPELVTRVLSRIERTRLRQTSGDCDGSTKGREQA